MRLIKIRAPLWVGLVAAFAAAAGAGAGTGTGTDGLDRIEMLDWSDPERAEELVDLVPLARRQQMSDVETLEVYGMVFADMHRDADVESTLGRLQERAQHNRPQALVAGHYVRAYSLYQRDRYAEASAELSSVDIASIRSTIERYRFSILRGNSLRLLGQAENALPFLEQGLDLAQEMH